MNGIRHPMNEFAFIRRRIRNPWPMGIECRLYMLVILAFVCGVAESVATGNWNWFQRSGAFVVVIGIYFAWRDLQTSTEHFRGYANSLFQDLVHQAQTAPIGGLLNASRSRENVDELTQMAAQMDHLFVALRNRIRTLEAVALAIGTLVSSYGAAFAG